MPCYHPVRAYQPDGGGSVVFREVRNSREIWLSCGQCVGCRLERSRQWAVRCMHEAQLHGPNNSFVTLTYAPAKLPPGGSLCYRDVQLFFKRVRKERGRFRYVVCGEYGEQLQRPHYHVIFFGLSWPDQQYWTKRQGNEMYRSPTLERLWPDGQSLIGSVTFQSAAYVARYSMKKVNGPNAPDHYRRVDLETGEVTQLQPEFLRMSLKPGIGARWLQKYLSDVYPRGKVVVNGREANPPRYYEKKYEELDPHAADELRAEREFLMYPKRLDNSRERLAVKETVAEARLKFKKREL